MWNLAGEYLPARREEISEERSGHGTERDRFTAGCCPLGYGEKNSNPHVTVGQEGCGGGRTGESRELYKMKRLSQHQGCP